MNSKKYNLTLIIKNHARRLLCPAIAAVLAVGILILSGYAVKPTRLLDFKKSPFKFNRLPAPKKKNLNKISATTTAGSLDPTFNLDGKLTTDFSSSEVANAVAVQANGKIVVAGCADTGDNYDFAVFRYNADGSLDSSFDGDGIVTTPIGSDYDFASAVAVQTDGKIIAAGMSGADYFGSFALVRYNADGSLDSSFGAGGKVITALSYYSGIGEIAIQTDGKIVAAGFSLNNATSYDFAIARYNPNGSLDASFGTGGTVTTDFEGDYDEATSVVVQADGKIIAAGRIFYDYLGSGFALARYNADGSLDMLFDTDGKVITNFDRYAGANAVAVQTDGKIIAAGYCDVFGNSGDYDFTVARYNTNGSLDASFDTDGKVITDFGNDDFAHAVALQTDGKIVAAGFSDNNATSYDFAIARYNSDGSLDTSFDADGKVTTDFGGDNEVAVAADVAIQTDGKIIAVGYSRNDSNYDFALSRYNTDGSLDTSFDTDGKVTTNFSRVTDEAHAVAVQIDGKIVAAGSTRNGSSDFALARYNTDGSLDSDYDGNNPNPFGYYGIVTTDFGNGNDEAKAVAVQADGKIIAAGSTGNGSNTDFALARYNSDGSLDTSFDTDGKVTTSIGSGLDIANAVAIQADGKIVAAGFSNISPTNRDFALVRYNIDGSPDNSFGVGGIVTTPIGNFDDIANAVAIQADGKIVAAGFSSDGTTEVFALTRYNTNGSLDTSFDTDGKVTTSIGSGLDIANAVAIQADGRIIAAGYSFIVRDIAIFSLDFAIVRYNPNGSLDTSFDTDGKVITAFGNNEDDFAQAVAIQSNGKIIAAGSNNNGINSNFALARLNPNGSLDTSFDADGKLMTDFGGGSDFANAVAIQLNGKIVAAGSSDNGASTDFAVARYIGDPVRTKFDYDGDGKSDVSVFRPSDRIWYLNRSTAGFFAVQFGLSSDKITPADYDGDGKTDIAVFRPLSGVWYWLNSSNGNFNTFQFGLASDIPVPADYDGDEKADVAVFRPSNGTWYWLNSSDGGFRAIQFGIAEDKPTIGDFDRDGKADIAVFRPSNGFWYRLNSSNGSFFAQQFGISEDKPVTGDYNGDGKTDVAVFRPSTGFWYFWQSGNTNFSGVQFGLETDIPTPGDYDGDGKTDIAVFRPSNGVWYGLQSSNGNVSSQQFGLNGDTPTPSAFVRQ